MGAKRKTEAFSLRNPLKPGLPTPLPRFTYWKDHSVVKIQGLLKLVLLQFT